MNTPKKYTAAFSQIDITPDYPTTLIGRNRPENSQGILHRICAQALLFQSENENFCLMAIDSLGLTVSHSNTVRSKIAEILKTDISHVMLNFSHTHSAPEPTSLGLNGEQYAEYLLEQIITCVQTAKQNFRPCKIGWTLSTAATGENRRPGGTATDNRLGALMVADARNDEPIVLAARIATHNNILPGTNLNVSNDFIGAAREELQKYYGFPIMVLQGAAGNIKAAGTNLIGEGSDDTLRKVAGILVDGVKNLHFELREVSDLQMFSKEIICVSDTPSKEDAVKIAAGNPGPDSIGWLEACEELRNKEIHSQSFPMEISFFKLNEGCICGVADEIFCELALDAQKRTNNPLLFLNGCTNGCLGYLPGYEEWYKGGYEVLYSYFSYYKYFGRVMPYRPDTAERIVDAVVKEWEQMVKGESI